MEFKTYSPSSFMFPFLFGFIYLIFIAIVCITVYRWVNTFIALKREQNDILREIANKMGDKSNKPE